MERKKISVAAFCAAMLAVGFVSCDSDSELFEGTVVDTVVAESNDGIGLSENEVELDDYLNAGEVEISSSDWVLSKIIFDGTTLMQTNYITNLGGDRDFEKSFDWLDVKYHGGVMSFSANDNFYPERQTDRRWAKLIFTYGEDNALTDTLTCIQLPGYIYGDGYIGIQPWSAHFPKEGGSCTFTMEFDTFCLDEIVFGDLKTGKRYDLQNPNDVYPTWYKPLEAYNATVEWVTLSRTEPYEFTVSVAPNETGEDRQFMIYVNILVEQNWITCYQSAE